MIKLKLTDKNKEINFYYVGKYIVYFDGLYYASNKGNFQIEIKNNLNDEFVNVKVPLLKPTEFSIFHGRIQYAYIYIKEKGSYTINFRNINDLKLSNTLIWPFWFLRPSNIPPDKVLVEIGR